MASNKSGMASMKERTTFETLSPHVPRAVAFQMPSGRAISQASNVAVPVNSRVARTLAHSKGPTGLL